VKLSCVAGGPAGALDPRASLVSGPVPIAGPPAVAAMLILKTASVNNSSSPTGRAAKAFRNQHNRMLAPDAAGSLPVENAPASGPLDLQGKAAAMQQVLKSRVGAKGIESPAQQDARVISRFMSLFEPVHRLVLIAQ
jgi:hypothetical protein